MAILDTKKAAELFSKFDVPISGYVVNRVVPPSLLERQIPDYLRNRIAMQRGHLDEIGSSFGGQVLAQVPEMERDITGLAMIEQLARTMYGD
jgi:arsenite-transporting ATPase